MTSKKMIIPDSENILITPLSMMRVLNVYPDDDGSFKSPLIGFIILVLPFFILSISVASIINVMNNDIFYLAEDLFENIVCVVVGTGLWYPSIYFRVHSQIFPRVALASSQFGKFGAPPGTDRLIEITRKLKIVCYAYCGIGSFVYIMSGVLEMGKCRRQLQEYPALIKSCGTAFPNLFDWPVTGWHVFAYDVVTGLSIMIMSFSAVSGAVCTTAPYVFMSLRVKDFIRKIRQFESMKSAEEVRNHFMYCVEYHQMIFIVYETLDVEISGYNTFYLFVFSVNISLSSYQVIYYFSVKAAMHCFGWIVACLIICYVGQHILNVTHQMSIEIYDIKFYEEKYKYIDNDLILMLMRSQLDMGISAGGFRFFNLETFNDIISGAFSYMTILKEMN